MKNMNKFFSLIALAVLVSACIKTEEDRGYVTRFSKFDQVQTGTTTKEQVKELLGTPSTESSFGDNCWYYISTKTETVALGSPDVVDQTVWAIHFNPEGVVSSVNKYTAADAREIAIAKDRTATEGDNFNIIQQFLGNIGRFNSDEDAAGGSGGVPIPRGARQ
ncbi:MAG: outer membrane protein assembly factor BamE [Proteobacteria bacterium]|nr:outer membrane protein assembly factor BamE [Pseudomonadota bacterium]